MSGASGVHAASGLTRRRSGRHEDLRCGDTLSDSACEREEVSPTKALQRKLKAAHGARNTGIPPITNSQHVGRAVGMSVMLSCPERN